MIKIPCHCGNIIESEIETEIDLGKNPEIYKNIINGDFMTFHCPECGNEIKAETALHLADSGNNLDLSFLPETERSNVLSGKIKTDSSRIVIGYRELVEKVVLTGEKLDDRIIEIIKFKMLQKAGDQAATIYFSSVDGENLIFHIHGLKPDKIGISKVPKKIYNSINNELEENLADEDVRLFTDGPYVSVSRIYLED